MKVENWAKGGDLLIFGDSLAEFCGFGYSDGVLVFSWLCIKVSLELWWSSNALR